MSVSPSTSYTGSYTVYYDYATYYNNSLDYRRLEQKIGSGAWTTVSTSGGVTSKLFSGKTANTYQYRIYACAWVCWSEGPVTVQVIAPNAPSTLTAPSSDTDGAYSLSWSASTGASSYQLQERLNSGSWSTIHNSSSRSKSVSGKSTGSWSYRVRACSTAGCSGWSSVKTVAVTLIPGAPSNLTVPSTDNDGSYSVSWTAGSGSSTSYTLQEQLNGGSWTTAQNTSATSYAASGKASGSYNYRVRGCNSAGCSAYTAVSGVAVAIAPSVPPSLTASPATSTDGSHTVSWGASSGSVTHYQLYQQIGSGNYTLEQSSTALSKSYTGLADGSYTYRVRACRTTGSYTQCSAYATSSTAIVSSPVPPNTPINLSAPASSTNGTYTINWAANTSGSAATHFTLQQKLNSGSWSTIQDTSATSKAVSGLGDGNYQYQVRACNNDGCSAYTSAVSVQVLATPSVPGSIQGPSVVDLNSSSNYTLSWAASGTGTVSSYVLEQQHNGGSWTQVQNDATLSETLTGQSYGTYKFRVKACNSLSCGAFTAEKTVTLNLTEVPAAAPAPANSTPPAAGSSAVVAFDQIGSVAGQFRVDESGSATYSIPIATAAGTAGVAPQISLNYSSQGGNGLVGKGWGISGLSGITRCRQTLQQDGAAKAITWSAEDRFCLDGQRLIKTSGTYGHHGSTYKTEIDSFAKITAVGGSAGHPSYFTVERKDGSVSTYGGNTDSKQQNGSSQTLTWAQSKFKDSVGNAINFKYLNDSNGQRIDRIYYAFGSSANGSSTTYLDFDYAERDDDISGYVAGHEFKTTQRLTKVKSINDGNIIREYNLTYKTTPTGSTANKQSKLQSIQECSSNICLTPTTFTWSNDQVGFSSSASGSLNLSPRSNRGVYTYKPADINGDGMMDLVWLEWEVDQSNGNTDHKFRYALSDGTKLVPASFSNGNLEITYYEEVGSGSVKLDVLDYNADGRMDAIVYNQTSGFWKVYLSTPQTDGSWKLTSNAYHTVVTNKNALFQDVNSDGLADAIYLVDSDDVTDAAVYIRYLTHNTAEGIDSNHYYQFGPQQQLTGPAIEPYQFLDWSTNPPGPNGPTVVSNLHVGDYSSFSGIAGDFNGDGRGDLVIKGLALYSSSAYFGLNWFRVYSVAEPDYQLYAQVPVVDTYSNFLRDPLAVDFNGDGLTDLTYNNEATKTYFKLNTGQGFTTSQETLSAINDSSLDSSNAKTSLDYNHDGYPDIVWFDHNADKIKVMIWDPEINSFGTAIEILSTSNDDKEAHLFLDMNGDGVSDYVNVKDDKLYTYPNLGANQPRNVITKITNGLGADTDITYGSLSNSGHYERLTVGTITQENEFCGYWYQSTNNCVGSYTFSSSSSPSFYSALNGNWAVPAGSHTLGKDVNGDGNNDPVLELNGPIYVVTEAKSDAPLASNAEAQSRISYYYGEAKVQASGRGFLGFQKIKSVDEQTGVETTTSYRQDFPFIGYPATTEVRSSAGHLLSEATNIWKLQGWSGSGSHTNKYYQPYIASSTEKTYDLASNGSQAGSLLQTVTTANTYDSYGNALVIDVDTIDGSNTFSKTTTNVYGTTTYEQEMGRLSRTTVVSSRPNVTNATRVSAFNYYTSGNLKGLLKDEIIEPDDPAYKLTTSYDYDAFGNKIKVTQSGQGVTSRFSESIYDAAGRYVNQTKNAYGQITETVVSRNTYGSPTAVQDINGVQTDFAYSAMGRQYWQGSATGAASTTLLAAPGTYCPSNAKYQSHTSDITGGEGYECFDRLGRSIRKVARGFNGSWIYSDTEYDNLGRVNKQSEPYYSGASKHWTTLSYDILGRVISTTLPGVTTPATVAYTGFTTVTTNPLGQTKTETKNVLGELTYVEDNGGNGSDKGRLSYSYDAQGNLLSVTSLGSLLDPHANVTTMTYDKLGRKLTMSDPDKGQAHNKQWSYTYNVFGELTLQTDAKDQTSAMVYDLLGRMTSRLDKKADTSVEANTVWSYYNGTTVASGESLGALDTVQDTVSGYIKTVGYDSLGRVSETITSLAANDDHYEKVTYDQYGRSHQVFDAAGDGTWQDNAIQSHYNAYGYLDKVTDAVQLNGQTKTTYYDVVTMDARGNVTEADRGNGITTERLYNAATGRLETLTSSSPLLLGDVQKHTYSWDDIGNLTQRKDQSGSKNLTETFSYDGLNRLTSSQVTGETAQTLSYNSLGNIITKSDVGTYTYGQNNAGPHAVTSTSDGVTYQYDENGNMTSDSSGRTLVYSTFDKPTSITKGAHTTTFKYGPDRSRYLRTDTNASGTKTTRYLGSVEKVTNTDNTQTIKRYLPGNVLVTISKDSSNNITDEETQYLHKDHLGSMDVITDATGIIEQELSFDAWGQRRNATQWTALTVSQLINFDHSNTTRGFTGHEMLDEVGLIHMNGRIYDPRLARFMQADPILQFPDNTQSYNRYSYVLNNPVRYTDPSGHIIPVIVGIGMAIAKAGALYTAIAVGTAAFAQTWVMGGSFGDALKAGVIAGVASYAFSSIGEHFSSFSNGNYMAAQAGAGNIVEFGGNFLKLGQVIGQISAHAIAGGVFAELQGGKFGHGFVSAGFTKGAMGGAGFDYSNGDATAVAGRTAIAAVIGGTASEISGGKFANGARTAAFAHLFNAEGKNLVKLAQQGVRVINKRYANTVHPKTGIPYDKDGYAVFDSVAEKTVEIAMTGIRTTDEALANAKAQLNRTPDGFTWHHVQDTKRMQLVPTDIHDATRHTGGVAVLKAMRRLDSTLSAVGAAIDVIDPSAYIRGADPMNPYFGMGQCEAMPQSCM